MQRNETISFFDLLSLHILPSKCKEERRNRQIKGLNQDIGYWPFYNISPSLPLFSMDSPGRIRIYS